MRTNLRDSVTPAMLAPGTKAKIVAHNTFQFTAPNGDKVTRLHNTDIVRVTPRGKTILQTGGWKTVTTKDRMTRYSSYHISQVSGLWSVNGVPYYDGMILPDAINAPTKKGATIQKQEKALRKQIREFVCTMPDKMPVPSNGDCWFCAMQTQDGKSLGESTHNVDHIREHIKEGYLHGSLILNAIKWAGVRRPELYWQRNLQDRAKSMLRRYLYRQMGLCT